MRHVLIAGSIAAAAASPLAAAAPCKDAKGRFVKCPPAPSRKGERCKDVKGRFVKCGAAGAKPA